MMRIGMLWFDNTPGKPLESKVREAAAYYYIKYGRRANLVMVHPETPIAETKVDGIEIQTSGSILSNHIWMGVKDNE